MQSCLRLLRLNLAYRLHSIISSPTAPYTTVHYFAETGAHRDSLAVKLTKRPGGVDSEGEFTIGFMYGPTVGWNVSRKMSIF